MEENLSNAHGLSIWFDNSTYEERKDIVIHGNLSTFVNCGSQYAIWHQFPEAIKFTLQNLDSGEVYFSGGGELSISWDGNQVYEAYAKEPCNEVVSKFFSISLNSIYFRDLPKNTVKNFKLQAEYVGHTSNSLSFRGVQFKANNP